MAENSDLNERLNLILENFIDKNKYKPAIEDLHKLENEYGNSDIIAYYLGVCYSNINDFPKTIQYLDFVNSSEDLTLIQLIQVNMILGYAFTEMEDYYNAEKRFKEALEINPKSSMSYSALGYVYYMSKKYDLALFNFKKAIQIDPNNASAHNNLGYTYAEIGINLTEAILECRKAIALSPQSAAYRDSLGWVYYSMGNYTDAVKELQNALQLISSGRKKTRDKQINNYISIINGHLNQAVKKRDL